jgi:hypothetical protein
MKCKILLAGATLLALPILLAQQPPVQPADPAVHRFGKVRPEADIEHTFTFRNDGPDVLEIDKVHLTPPLTVVKMPARIAPGAEGGVTVKMEKPYPQGEFYGGVVVLFKNKAREPLEFGLEGEIVPPIQVLPYNVILLSTQRGQPKSASVEIINHETDPVEISTPQCPAGRFTCELQTLEPGRRYELTVTLKGEGPGAEQNDLVVLSTSSRENRFLEVRVLTKIRDRVYAFPERLNLETIDANYLKNRPQMTNFLRQSIMVYQAGGTAFLIGAETDVPFLKLSIVQSEKFKDRAEVQVSVDPTRLRAGPVEGSITVATNDPEFPRVVIPVTGRVEGNY